MITRIRYKTEKGHMNSITPLLAKTKMISVGIDLLNMSYIIFDEDDTVIAGGCSTSKQKILQEVKKEVKALGVLFHDEIRPRKIKVSKNLSNKMLGDEDESISDTRVD